MDKKVYAAFMDLEKAYDKVNSRPRALREILLIYGVGGHLLEEIKAFYKIAETSVWVEGGLNESFSIGVGLRQGCVMSLWLFTNEGQSG